jgi:hypothetical protein
MRRGWCDRATSLGVSLSFSYSKLAVPSHYSFANPENHDG